jgi:hypothetical protein
MVDQEIVPKLPKTSKRNMFVGDCIALQRLGLVACLFYGCTSEAVREPPRPRPVSGTLVLSGFVGTADDASPGPTQHTSLLVPGLNYGGMQDNDIRGFPNGDGFMGGIKKDSVTYAVRPQGSMFHKTRHRPKSIPRARHPP